MFNQLTRWFMNLRFGSKLLIGFGIMVVISIVIGAAALTTTTLITNSTNDANTAAGQSTLAEHIRADMEVAHNDEAGYFLNYNTLGLDTAYARYAVANQEQINQLVESLVELQKANNPNLASDRPVIRLVALAQDQMKTYQEAFNAAVSATQDLGVDRTGLTGQVRTDAEALLAAPELADPASQVILLQMRRNEKDFMLFGTQTSLDQVYAFETQLENQINALTIPGDRKNELLALAQSYLADFNAVVQKTHEIATDLNNLDLISTNIDQLLTEVSNEERVNTDNAMASLRSVANLARAVNITALALAILFGLGLALVLRRLLTRQVKEIDLVFGDVRVGEFGSRAKIFGKDELGRMADGVNALLEQMTGLLARGEVQLQAILNNAPVMLYIKNMDYQYTLASPQYEALVGTSVVGKTDYDFLSKEAADRFRTMDQQVLESKTPLIVEEVLEVNNKPTFYSSVKFPLYDPDGNLYGMCGISTDISERKQAEAAREQMIDEMARQKAVLDNINDLAGITDLEGHLLYVNGAGMDMLGRADEDYTQLSVLDFYPPERGEGVMAEHLAVVRETGIWTGETVFLHKNGTEIPVQQSIVLIWDKVGEPQAVGTIGRDLREQKRIVKDVEIAATQVTDASTAMTGIVQQLVEQASSSAQVAEQAASRTQEGDRVVNETVAAMGRIRDNTQETAQRIKRLGEVSQEIGEAVRLIEEVADRTTVLALNASIQAAVAGEAGRGFAVVAEEVQRLAERATGATRKIEDLIKSIQAETNQAVIGIEEATREVVDGSQLAQKAGDRMAELNQLVAQLADLVQQVAETTSKQTGTSMTSLVQLSKGLQESVAEFGVAKRAGGDGHELPGHPASSLN